MKNKKTASITPYPELNIVLQNLVLNEQEILGDNFVAAYLQGSFATGGFDEHSDCDFIIVINEDLSDLQLRNLQSMHKRIFDLDMEWAKHLEGSYFPKAILRDYIHRGRDLWYLDNGHSELMKSNHCNTAVVRWTLREYGVILSGPKPSTLIEPIPAKDLRQEILAVIVDWGQQIMAEPKRFNNRFYQSFIVLSYCRMLHDLHNGAIGSKRAGTEWTKRNMDRSWTDLIDRAWLGRPNPALSIRQPANQADFQRTLRFIKEVTRAAEDIAAEKGIRGG
jgi:predicted nucleotidyltransferase